MYMFKNIKKRMQKLVGIKPYTISEAYLDSKGDLVDKNDFVVLEGGFRGGILVDEEKINISDFIHFTQRISKFRKKDVAKNVCKQILKIYKGTALEKYNQKIGFTPEFSWSSGGGFEAPGYDLFITDGISIHGLSEPSHYFINTGFDDYIKQMRKDMGVSSEDEPNSDSDKNMSLISKEDLEDKLLHNPTICIPKIMWSGRLLNQIDHELDIQNTNFSDKHDLYPINNIKNDMNEIGLFLISNSQKSPEVNLDETDYSIYLIKPDAMYKGHYHDGSGWFYTHYNTPFLMLVPDNVDWREFLKSTKDSNPSELSPYSFIFGGTTPSKTKTGVYDDVMEASKPQVLKYKDITIPRNIFNELKKLKIKSIDLYNDKDFKTIFPELTKPIPKRKVEGGKFDDLKEKLQRRAGILK